MPRGKNESVSDNSSFLPRGSGCGWGQGGISTAANLGYSVPGRYQVLGPRWYEVVGPRYYVRVLGSSSSRSCSSSADGSGGVFRLPFDAVGACGLAF